jgi:hypothetical protein
MNPQPEAFGHRLIASDCFASGLPNPAMPNVFTGIFIADAPGRVEILLKLPCEFSDKQRGGL